MKIEREFLKKLRYASLLENDLRKELEELLAQPEQDKAGAVMPNGVPVSNVYDAYEEGRKSVMSEQEPVGYLYKQMDCTGEWATIFKVEKPYITWHDIKDIVTLYTAPPKRKFLSVKQAKDIWGTTFKSAVPYYTFYEICVAIEQYHEIGEDDE